MLENFTTRIAIMLTKSSMFSITEYLIEQKCFCSCIFIIHHKFCISLNQRSFWYIYTYSFFPYLATHLSLQNYHICFRRASGKCGICFVPSTTITSTNSASSQVNFLTNYKLMLYIRIGSFFSYGIWIDIYLKSDTENYLTWITKHLTT